MTDPDTTDGGDAQGRGKEDPLDGTSDTRTPDPIEAALADLFADFPEDEPDGPAPDASRVASHFAGVGDAALLEDAARRPSVRRLLADVAAAEAADADRAPAVLAPDVIARAIAAFGPGRAAARQAVPEAAAPVAGRLRALPGGRRRTALLGRVAAAVLLVLVPVGVVASLTGRFAEASPVLRVLGLERLGGDGAMVAEGPRSFVVGSHLRPEVGERLALHMPGGARVIFRSGDEAHVACAATTVGGPACAAAALALDRGEALLLAAESATEPAPLLLLPDGGRLEVLAGAVHVAWQEPGVGALALREDARVRWTRGGAGPLDLAGPGAVLLAQAAPRVDALASRDARALFRDLAFFGGELRAAMPLRRVAARHWRVLRDGGDGAPPSGAVTRASDAHGAPALRMDLDAGAGARLAWEPDAQARESARMTVLLACRPGPRAAPGAAPAAGPARLRVALEGVPGAEAVLDLAEPGLAEPGGAEVPSDARSVVLTLPSGWASDRDPGAEVVVCVRAEGGPAVAWFTGAAFSAAPSTKSPGSGGDTPSSSLPSSRR